MNSLNNLIKSLMLAMVILGGTSFSMADPLPGDDPIIFELGRHDPTIAHGDYPRNPINPPSAYLDDHTLYIISTANWKQGVYVLQGIVDGQECTKKIVVK